MKEAQLRTTIRELVGGIRTGRNAEVAVTVLDDAAFGALEDRDRDFLTAHAVSTAVAVTSTLA